MQYVASVRIDVVAAFCEFNRACERASMHAPHTSIVLPACMHAFVVRMHTRTHAHTRMHACACMHTRIAYVIYIYMAGHIYTCTHTCSNGRAAPIHMHTYYQHTHTHTYLRHPFPTSLIRSLDEPPHPLAYDVIRCVLSLRLLISLSAGVILEPDCRYVGAVLPPLKKSDMRCYVI